MAQAGLEYACDGLDFASARDRVGSVPARTQSQRPSLLRSQSFRLGLFKPRNIGRVAPGYSSGFAVMALLDSDTLVASARFHVCGRPRAAQRPACSAGSASLQAHSSRRLVWLLPPGPQAGASRRATQRRRSEARKPFDSGRAWHLPDLIVQAMASRGQEATRTWRA